MHAAAMLQWSWVLWWVLWAVVVPVLSCAKKTICRPPPGAKPGCGGRGA